MTVALGSLYDPNAVQEPLFAPDTIARKRRAAEAMLASGMDYSPIQSKWQGLSRVAQALLGGFEEGQLDRQELAANAAGAEALSGMMPSAASAQTASVAPSAPSSHNGTGPSAFSTVAPKLMQALQSDYGVSPEQAAGVVGALAHESGGFNTMQEINPQGGRGGLGYAQWTGPRRAAFEALLNGRAPNDFGANYDMIKQELSGPEGKVLAALKQARTPEEAQQIWTSQFERPGIVANDSRNAWAQRAMALNGGSPAMAAAPHAPGIQVASADPNFVPQMPQGSPMAPADNPGGNFRAPIAQPAPQPSPAPQQVAQASPMAQGGQYSISDQMYQNAAKAIGSRALMANPAVRERATQVMEQYQKEHSPQYQNEIRLQNAQLQEAEHRISMLPVDDATKQAMLDKARFDLQSGRAEEPGKLQAQDLNNKKLQSDLDRVGVTPQQDNYNAYVRDQTARGLPILSQDDWQIRHERANALTTEGALESGLGKGLSDMYVGMMNEGNNARVQNGQLETLRGLLQQNPGGLAGGLIGFANANGIPLGKNPDAAQAAQSIIAKLIPAQRVAGSGTTSDYDARMFSRAMPSLMNQPGGNEMIIDTMQAMNDYKAKQGDIATALANKEIDQPTASKMLKDLGDPFAGIKQAHPEIFGGKAAPAPAANPAQQGSFPNAPAAGTEVEGYIYTGGDPAQQSSWRKK